MGISAVQEARVPIGYHQLTTLTTAQSCPGTGSLVMIQAEAQNLRYRVDGINPTAAVGMLLAAGECHSLNLGAGRITDIKVIETVVGGILNVTTFR